MPEEQTVADTINSNQSAPADTQVASPVVQTAEEGTLLGVQTKPPEDGPKDTKDGDSKQTKEVPEKYEVKVPEGMTVDQASLEKLTPVFKELGLSQEGVQKLIDVYAPEVQRLITTEREAGKSAFKEIVAGWRQATLKELGADHERKMAAAAKVLDRFGSVELRQLMDDYGVGNHPEFVRFFLNVGKVISEDHFVDPNLNQGGYQGINPEVMYPTMKK